MSSGAQVAAAGSVGSSFDSAGPRDSLKLLKRRQQNAPVGGEGGGAAGDYGQRAVSATGRAPQVRLPFEELT